MEDREDREDMEDREDVQDMEDTGDMEDMEFTENKKEVILTGVPLRWHIRNHCRVV